MRLLEGIDPVDAVCADIRDGDSPWVQYCKITAYARGHPVDICRGKVLKALKDLNKRTHARESNITP